MGRMSDLDLYICELASDEQDEQELRESINRYLHKGTPMSDKAYQVFRAFEELELF